MMKYEGCSCGLFKALFQHLLEEMRKTVKDITIGSWLRFELGTFQICIIHYHCANLLSS